MWVFGYGSLIWDGWENKEARRCLRAARAELPGYRRCFNKKSVANWGTRGTPCPTLNLQSTSSASCHGMAFEFPNDAWFLGKMLRCLRRREACEPTELPIQIEGIGEAPALVYTYSGPNLIRDGSTPEQLAAMALGAKGNDGLCVNYIKGIAEKLEEIGIRDPAVTELWQAVRAIK
jgi:glutathione-specific gamma-glutamylcyclotransferase